MRTLREFSPIKGRLPRPVTAVGGSGSVDHLGLEREGQEVVAHFGVQAAAGGGRGCSQVSARAYRVVRVALGVGVVLVVVVPGVCVGCVCVRACGCVCMGVRACLPLSVCD